MVIEVKEAGSGEKKRTREILFHSMVIFVASVSLAKGTLYFIIIITLVLGMEWVDALVMIT